MMAEIATVVSVMGDDAYFKMAQISIPSFLRNNVSADLFVFTDDVNKLSNISSDRIYVIDMLERFKECGDLIEKARIEEDAKTQIGRYGRIHSQLYIAPLVPVAEEFFARKKYSHILKIDADGYFAGGDMMSMVREDVRQAPGFDLYLVKRTHDLMCLYGGGAPGTGFALWRKGSDFASQYVKRFTGSYQVTILKLRRKIHGRFYVLGRPGYHFVYPFEKAKRTNREFTKEIASEFLPAYFHLLGKDALKNMRTLDGWFGEASNVV